MSGASSPNQDGWTPLHHAAAAGNKQNINLLLSGKYKHSVQDVDGCTALQVAAANGHDEIVQLLIEKGWKANIQDTIHGNAALHEAAWKGYSRTVGVLCKNNVDLNLKNQGGFAPLHLCCQNGHNQCCRELLMSGCDPDVKNNYGDTPLHTSARYGHAGVMRILISAKCAASEQNKNGDTALHIAAAMCRRKLTKILLEAGCDVNLKNRQEETCIGIAQRKNFLEILEIFAHPPPVVNHHEERVTSKQQKSDKSIKPDSGVSSKGSSSRSKDRRHHRKHKVRFEHHRKSKEKSRGKWSPYGCHYSPDLREFPSPNLDSLPKDPLSKGEQYYLDLAGNIRKGPVGVGITCYCGPLLCSVSNQIHQDKKELLTRINSAKDWLDQRLTEVEEQTKKQIKTFGQNVQERLEAERLRCKKRGEVAAAQQTALLEQHSENVYRWLQNQMDSQLSRCQTASPKSGDSLQKREVSSAEPVYKTLCVSDRPMSAMRTSNPLELSGEEEETSSEPESIHEVINRLEHWKSSYSLHQDSTKWEKRKCNSDVCSNVGTIGESVALQSERRQHESDTESYAASEVERYNHKAASAQEAYQYQPEEQEAYRYQPAETACQPTHEPYQYQPEQKTFQYQPEQETYQYQRSQKAYQSYQPALEPYGDHYSNSYQYNNNNYASDEIRHDGFGYSDEVTGLPLHEVHEELRGVHL